MPEIIEVEHQRRQLHAALQGRSLVYYESLYVRDGKEILDHLLRKHSLATFEQRCLHHPISGVRRIGKNLVFEIAEYGTVNFLQVHLNSTGWFIPGNALAEQAAPVDNFHKQFIKTAIAKDTAKHAMVALTFDDGQLWLYCDPRTWGRFYPWTFDDLAKAEECDLMRYGLDWMHEPQLAFERLLDYKRASSRKIKQILLDQTITTGIGNYLVCEILFRAGIDPDYPWVEVSDEHLLQIAQHLTDFIDHSLPQPDYKHWLVFGKKAPCPCCGTPIAYKKDAPNSVRASYFCPTCQVLPDRAGANRQFTNIPPSKRRILPIWPSAS